MQQVEEIVEIGLHHLRMKHHKGMLPQMGVEHKRLTIMQRKRLTDIIVAWQRAGEGIKVAVEQISREQPVVGLVLGVALLVSQFKVSAR